MGWLRGHAATFTELASSPFTAVTGVRIPLGTTGPATTPRFWTRDHGLGWSARASSQLGLDPSQSVEPFGSEKKLTADSLVMGHEGEITTVGLDRVMPEA